MHFFSRGKLRIYLQEIQEKRRKFSNKKECEVLGKRRVGKNACVKAGKVGRTGPQVEKIHEGGEEVEQKRDMESEETW